MTGFPRLPPETRVEIINRLVDHWRLNGHSESLAPYATVNHEWQAVIERYTFRELRLTYARLNTDADTDEVSGSGSESGSESGAEPEAGVESKAEAGPGARSRARTDVLAFDNIVRGHRRRWLSRINLHVDLPAYDNDPCEERESWEDKRTNNAIFTRTWQLLFHSLAGWADEDVAIGGIALRLSVSSESDLRNSPFHLWQRRRWHSRDIGEKRFEASYLDFIGQDEEHERQNLLLPVFAVTSFRTCPLIRRAIVPVAFSDIIARLPRVREAHVELIREHRLVYRRAFFDELGSHFTQWPATLETLHLSSNTACSWRQLPHEAISEGETGEGICNDLRTFAVQLRELRITNLVRVREFLRPVWPARVEDKDPFLEVPPDLPVYPHLEVLDLTYSALHFKPDWHKDSPHLHEHDDTERFRQAIALAAARLALHMPRLRLLVVRQRPMMWAGKHVIEYAADGDGASVTWTSTFPFRPWERTIEAWSEVARRHTGHKLRTEIRKIDGWKTDGSRPLTPAMSL